MKPLALALLALSASALRGADNAPPGPPGTVTLPLAEYDRLVDRARDGEKRPPGPPVAAVLAKADLRVRVAEGTARGSFSLEGEVFRTGPTRVALVSAVTLLDARLAGKPLPLFRDGEVVAAVVTGPAPFSIALDWAAPVVSEPGRASLALPVPAAGSARVSLDLPGEQMDVRIEPGLVTQRTSAGGRTLVEATLEPGHPARVSWSAREASATATAREVRLLSDVKTLVTLGESEVRLTILVEVNVVQGEPRSFALRLPPGFELVGVSGSALDTTSEKAGTLTLTVTDEALRHAVFLVSLERANPAGTFETDVPFVTVEGAQRETGELSFEGVGTLELTATEGGTLRRMDVREVAPPLRALSRQPLLAAFRYQRRADEAPTLKAAVRRFPDAPVLAALAERAQVTTLVTSEGRMLTEIALTVRNQAQPFLRVGLPEGATLLSADVAGESVKPVQGDGGSRVPLLRAGFRPEGPYRVSFTYLHSGVALGRKGTAEIALPKLDIPLSLVEWELFLPDRYKVKTFGGNVMRAELDPRFSLKVATMEETVTVEAQAPMIDEKKTGTGATFAEEPRSENLRVSPAAPLPAPPSSNVLNLQRRVAGVLPVRVTVPREGTSHRFLRPLVVDEETTVTFRYESKR